MARVVCRVHRSDEQLRASLAWSEGPDEFPKYHLDGQLYRQMEETGRKVRETLGHVVKDYALNTPDDIRRTTAYELAQAGHDLYQHLFWAIPEYQTHAEDVRQWLTELRDRDEVESLELVVDSPWSVPWNAVYDQEPDKAAFRDGPPNGSQWEPFWGIRYRLAASRGGGSPLRRTATLESPRVLLVGDSAHPDLQDVVAELRAFAAEHQLTFVDCLADLERELQDERPDLLYWLSHAEPSTLVLGGEEISASDLLRLLRKPGVFSGLAFLNCCGTAVESDTGSFLDTLRNVGFSGLIGTEQITYSTDASRLGLSFLQAFLLHGEPAGEALRRLRREEAPLGLVYGTYCPPLLRVQRVMADEGVVSVATAPVEGEQASVPSVALGETEAGSLPLPDEPYRGLAYFERQDRALFEGRHEDAVRCAELLDRDDTRFLLLHGESGVGKSSFLRAGLIPYLEEERVGYRFLRSRRSRADEAEAERESALFVRCTSDPFGQLAEALSDFCARPITYRTPGGAEQTVDLPKVLAEAAGSAAASDLRRALHDDARLLGRVLAHLGSQLPFRLVTTIDQAEELYTLSRTEEDKKTRRRALEMLRRALDTAGDFKLIVTLRTEYASRLADALRRGQSDPRRIGECLLSNLDAKAIAEAVLSPARFDKWRFSYEPGVAQEIAKSAVALQEDADASILPLVQVVCEQLYESVRNRPDPRITLQDWEALGGIDGALQRHVDESLETIVRKLRLSAGDRRALCRLLDQLHLQRPDGTIATALVAETEASERWTGNSDFEQVLKQLVRQHLVRRDLLRIGDKHASYLSLGHDRLVEPIVAWESQERRATSRGRAELRLAERSARWNTKPENQQLPSWWEYVSILSLTPKQNWTEPQCQMMQRAGWFYGLRVSIAVAAVFLFALAGVTIRRNIATAFERAQRESIARENAARADELVGSLRNAHIGQVSEIVDQLRPYRELAGALLSEQIATAIDGSPQRLNLSLALLSTDAGQVNQLYDQLLQAESAQFPVIREFLSAHADKLTPRLWEVATDSTGDNERRSFKAACALATYDAKNPRWKEIRDRVAADLVTVNPAFLGSWKDALQPVSELMIEPLSAIYRDEQQGEVSRSLATAVLSEYAKDNVQVLTDLVSYGDEEQFGVLFPVLRQHQAGAVSQLKAVLEENLVADWEDPALDSSWQAVGPGIKHAIDSAHGSLADRFALCQTMPLEEFDEVVESLRASGYRPLRFRPFAHKNSVLVAAIWRRDGRDWQLAYGLTDEEAVQRDEQLRSEGFVAVDVAGYVASNGEGPVDQYGGVWVKRASDADDSRIYVGVSNDEHQNADRSLDDSGYSFQHSIQSFRTVDGQQKYCGVRLKASGVSDWSWNQTPDEYGQKEFLDRILWENDVSKAAEVETKHQADLRYATIWQTSRNFESLGVHGLSPEDHLERFAVFESQDYRPVSISTASLDEGNKLVTASVWHRPITTDEEKEVLVQRQANVAVALLRMDQPDTIWPLLRLSPDPRLRTWIIHRLRPLGVSAETIANQLETETEASIRRALILALGEYESAALTDRETLTRKLLDFFEHDPDPGVHGAAQWALRQHGQEPEVARISERPAADASTDGAWYVTSQGQTMVKISGPIEFLMGSRGTEANRQRYETLHRKRIDRSFAIGSTEVTIDQFQSFLPQTPSVQHSYNGRCPQTAVSWYEAAAYCRWLSEQEGISNDQMCYPEIPHIREGMELAADHLSRTGYRLPTEAEWEYACRAGTATSRFYGETEQLVGRYGWHTETSNNRAWPVGGLKPNDFGLFDMYGNVYEWCQESYRSYQVAGRGLSNPDAEDELSLDNNRPRVMRGGSFATPQQYLRSADRYREQPMKGIHVIGFRLARTYP